MKLTIAFLLTLSSLAQAQVTSSTDSLFQVTYSLGSEWDKSKQPSGQLYFKEHSAHLSTLRKEGVIKLGARYADKGVIFITAKDMEAAKKLVNSDEAVAHKLFETNIQKLYVFYEGCIERPK